MNPTMAQSPRYELIFSLRFEINSYRETPLLPARSRIAKETLREQKIENNEE
jgi:hypothetical protein